MVDVLKNLAYSTVAVAPTPGTSGLTCTMQSGDGTFFPTGDFDVSFWPADTISTPHNTEICRCTIVGDVLTMSRGYYDTPVQDIAVGFQCANTVTANLLTQIIALVAAAEPALQHLWLSYEFTVSAPFGGVDASEFIPGASNPLSPEFPFGSGNKHITFPQFDYPAGVIFRWGGLTIENVDTTQDEYDLAAFIVVSNLDGSSYILLGAEVSADSDVTNDTAQVTSADIDVFDTVGADLSYDSGTGYVSSALGGTYGIFVWLIYGWD
jgi:hypothetical protein